MLKFGLDFVKYTFNNRIICLAHGQHDKVNQVIEDLVKYINAFQMKYI